MNADQALRALTQLRSAAPPTTSERIGDVITVIRQLEGEIDALRAQLNQTPPSAAGLIRQLEEENSALRDYEDALRERNETLQAQLDSIPPGADDLLPQAFAALQPAMKHIRDQALSLRSGRLGQLTTEQKDCLQFIDAYAATSLTLVSTLDDIIRIRQGVLTLEPLLFSGLDLLAEAWQQLYREAEEHEHQISIHADDPLPAVVGDYRHVLTIMSDLLDNAIRYTPFGGTIRITAETLGTHVLFSIADNGIGLSPEDVKQVGTPFWRALHQPLVRQQPGSGLRLFRARHVLALHESELYFSGELGMGSTFSFALHTG